MAIIATDFCEDVRTSIPDPCPTPETAAYEYDLLIVEAVIGKMYHEMNALDACHSEWLAIDDATSRYRASLNL